MKTKQPFLIISTVLVFMLACNALAQSSTDKNNTTVPIEEAALSSPAPDQVSETPTALSTSTTLPTIAPPPQDEGGKWIAFNSRLAGNSDIYIIDTTGENLTQLTDSPGHDLYPSWSPDGTRIVYQTNDGEDQELAIVVVATKEVFQLTNNDCNDWGPVWSIDNWIVFYSDCDSERNIYKIRENGLERTQLTFTSGSNSWFPSWSPNGRKITFSSNRSGKYNIYTMNADGSNPSRPLAKGCVSYYSPDGSQILYGVYCDDTDALWLMNADGSDQHPITDGYECRNATWSPDGTKIIFQLSRTTKEGPFAIYIMSLDKPDKSDWFLLTDFDINGGSPVWQP